MCLPKQFSATIDLFRSFEPFLSQVADLNALEIHTLQLHFLFFALCDHCGRHQRMM